MSLWGGSPPRREVRANVTQGPEIALPVTAALFSGLGAAVVAVLTTGSVGLMFLTGVVVGALVGSVLAPVFKQRLSKLVVGGYGVVGLMGAALCGVGYASWQALAKVLG